MMVYLVRHAHALDADEDAERPLSPKGREQVERLARFLRGTRAVEVEEVWHSPLVRARQTARLLAEGLGTRAPLSEVPGLEPEHDVGAIAARLGAASRAVAVVGHEPHLGSLASLLIAGDTRPLFVVRKASVIALERMGAGPAVSWFVRWHVSPELLGV